MSELSPSVANALALFHKAAAKEETKKEDKARRLDAVKRLTPKRKPQLPSPVKSCTADSPNWNYEALVLPISRLICTCGAVTETPGRLLLARRHKKTGALWESTEGACCELPILPRRRRMHEVRIPVCSKCYAGLQNLELLACLKHPMPEQPVPIFDTPAAYIAESETAKKERSMRLEDI